MGETIVTVEFNAVGGNRTEVVITHQGFAEPARKDRHQQGWTGVINLLERYEAMKKDGVTT